MTNLGILRRKLEGVVSQQLSVSQEFLEARQQQRHAFIEDCYQRGGRGFVERVQKYGCTEKGEPIKLSPWYLEYLLLIGDFRLPLALTTGCSQIGKAQPLDAKVLTPEGWQLMGELQPGDWVIASDGKPSHVLAVFPQGQKDIYQLTLDDGSQTECCDEHLWLTQTADDRKDLAFPEVKPLSDIRLPGCFHYQLPKMNPANFTLYWRRIESIAPIGRKEAQCILIDHPSHLYVTDDYIVTHNTLGHTFLNVDIITTGKLNSAWFYDSRTNLEQNVPMQFVPVADFWIARMQEDGIRFRRGRDLSINTRFQVDQVNAIFSYVSTSRPGVRDTGAAAAGGAAISFQADMMFMEERSQYPPGAADPLPRRLDASMLPSRPVRELGTPGGGNGIEAELRDCDRYFYPHYTCEQCGITQTLDPKGCLLKKVQWRDALGRLKQSYLSESGRPVEWWHTDPNDRVKTAYFGCAYCGHPISDEQRLNAHFRCIQTDQSAIEFIESLPPGLPERNWKIGIHLSPLCRDAPNLASGIIQSGLDASTTADFQQQRLGHPSETEAASISLEMMRRAMKAPLPQGKPNYTLAGIDIGRSEDWLVVIDFWLPKGYQRMKPIEIFEKTIRGVRFAKGMLRTRIVEALRDFGVEYGLVDNEPSRESSMKLCVESKVLELADQYRLLKEVVQETIVEDGGLKMKCWNIRDEKFLAAVLEGFLLESDDGWPLYRLPPAWEKWLNNPSENSPLRHLSGPYRDPQGEWHRGPGKVDDMYFATAFWEAAFYLKLTKYARRYVGEAVSGPRPIQRVIDDL